MAKMTTIRLFLALAAIHGWHLTQLNVHIAFLNGDLNEEIHMDSPPGYIIQGEFS